MKNLILFLLSFSPCFLYSQIPANSISIEDAVYDAYVADSKITISGRIRNFFPAEQEKIAIKYNVVVPLRKFEGGETKANTEGVFEIVIPQVHPLQQIWLEIGDYFYGVLYVRKQLTLDFNFEKLRKARVWAYGEGVQFGGFDGELNSFMGKYNLKQNNFNDPLNAEKEALLSAKTKLPSAEFAEKFDKIMSKYKAQDDAFIQENPSPFAWIIENERLSYYYHSVCSYHWGRKMDAALWEKVRQHRSFVMSQEACRYYSYLFKYVNYLAANEPSIDFGSPQDWRRVADAPDLSPAKRALIDKIVENPYSVNDATFKTFEKEMDFVLFEKTTLFTVSMLDSLFEQPKADLLKFHMDSKKQNEQKIIVDVLLNNIKTEWCKNFLSADYDKKMRNIEKVNQALTSNSSQLLNKPLLETPFGAKLYRIDKGDAPSVLASLKQKAQNKALIIDFWATWCGPCIEQMSTVKKIQDETQDVPVEYVFICTSRGATMDKWMDNIMSNQLSGTHIFLDDAINADLMQLFSFSTFPNYAFIDRTGKFITGVFSDKTNFKAEKIRKLAQ